MITIKTPATSANLGPGFDSFGLALQIYNTFEVETSNTLKIDNVPQRYNNPNNLFVKAYQKGCQAIGIHDSIHVKFDTNIPVSRGLGSSASLICGGLYAASVLHDSALSSQQIFQLASVMEGHPDNAAPCIFGGLMASLKEKDIFFTHRLSLHEDWKYTVFIPDFKVSTEQARKILPSSYPRNIVASNGAHAALMAEALRTGDLSLLKKAAVDQIHEPYRKTLIDEFDALKEITQPYGAFLISGSGSTCILISKETLQEKTKAQISHLKHHWKVLETNIANHGVEVIL